MPGRINSSTTFFSACNCAGVVLQSCGIGASWDCPCAIAGTVAPSASPSTAAESHDIVWLFMGPSPLDRLRKVLAARLPFFGWEHRRAGLDQPRQHVKDRDRC